MFFRSISPLLAGLLLALVASSQTQTTGRITGTVIDPRGAVIVGAEIRVEDPANGVKCSAVSDNSGSYSVFQLPPATYAVTIRARGFSPATFDDVAVALATTSIINATLQVAQSGSNRK